MKKNKLFLISVLITTLSSCSFYNPISTNVPSYEKQGEINVGVNLGTSADIQVSTNPIEHLSIIGTASTSGSVTNESGAGYSFPDSIQFNYKRNQFEIGLGYYYMLTDNIQHDLHVGYGFGSAAKRDNFLFEEDWAYRADVSNIFIQSSLVFRLEDDVKGYLTSKFNYLSISGYEHTTNYIESIYSSYEKGQFRNEKYWLNQFGIGLIFDLGPLQISAQGQLNLRFTNNLFLKERPMGLYTGINFNIAEIRNRIRQKE